MLALSNPMPVPADTNDDDHEPPASAMREGLREDLNWGVPHDFLLCRAIERQVACNAMPGLSDTDRKELVQLMCDDPIVQALFDKVYQDVLAERD